MITGYGIILEDSILYCSNENIYNAFEIVLFVEKLISSINPKQTWRLNNIYLKGYRMSAERMIIKHLITEEKKNLFYCISGDFDAETKQSYKMLEEFYEKVKSYYKTSELLKEAGQKPVFKEIIEVITDHLWDKYEDLIEDEKSQNLKSDSSCTNNILYCGISSQGLPIISQVYSRILLDNLGIEITEENVDLLASNLSAKLATIAMNTVIRAKTSIREIHINDISEKNEKKLILFGDIDGFTLDFFGSGNYLTIKKVFKNLKNILAKEDILHKEFLGDLKPYRYLHQVIEDFYEAGL